MQGKVFYIIGKSSTGKDSLSAVLLKDETLNLKEIVQYTTRPIRDGETEGKEYHFISNERVQELEHAGKIIEIRTYHTIYGDWHYLMVDDGEVDLSAHHYLAVGTVESYERIRDYYPKGQVIPIYIEVETGERLQRALDRERKHENPKYTEMCRRFLADEQDFDKEHLQEAGLLQEDGTILNCIKNDIFEKCVQETKEFIRSVSE